MAVMMPQMKTEKNAMDTTLTDVILTACGLEQLMQETPKQRGWSI